MARHINRLFKPLHTVEPSRIIFANGVTSLCDELGFTLCDPGDAILMSRPIYQAFKSDFGTKAKYELIFLPPFSSRRFIIPDFHSLLSLLLLPILEPVKKDNSPSNS